MNFLLKNWRWAAVKNGMQDAMAYRSDLIISFFASAVVPAAVQIVLWYALFIIGHNDRIAGQSFQDMIHYTIASILFSQVRGGNLDFELAEMIRDGSLSQYLLRPVSPVEFVYFRGIASKIFIAGFCLCLGFLACFFFHFSFLRLIGGMFLAFLGNVILYQLSSVVAASAFYWEEAYSLIMVKNLVVSLLSGELLPLYLFPENLQWVWKSTPFYLFVFGPVQYTLGKWTHTEFLFQIGIAFAWMIGGWVLIKLCWGRAIKNYSSIGG